MNERTQHEGPAGASSPAAWDHAGDELRVRALGTSGILDTPREERFDRIARLARLLFGVSGAAVNFIAADRQWTKAESGLEGLVNVPLDTVAKVSEATAQLFDDSASFATLYTARVDPGSGDVEYIDAGHGLAFIVDRHAGLRRLRPSGPPLGMIPGAEWELHRDRLEPGETLVVVSDGLLDLFPSLDEAMAEALRQRVPDRAVGELVERIIGLAARRWHEDDVTVLALRRLAA